MSVPTKILDHWDHSSQSSLRFVSGLVIGDVGQPNSTSDRLCL